jgi:hypothetical protein
MAANQATLLSRDNNRFVRWRNRRRGAAVDQAKVW